MYIGCTQVRCRIAGILVQYLHWQFGQHVFTNVRGIILLQTAAWGRAKNLNFKCDCQAARIPSLNISLHYGSRFHLYPSSAIYTYIQIPSVSFFSYRFQLYPSSAIDPINILLRLQIPYIPFFSYRFQIYPSSAIDSICILLKLYFPSVSFLSYIFDIYPSSAIDSICILHQLQIPPGSSRFNLSPSPAQDSICIILQLYSRFHLVFIFVLDSICLFLQLKTPSVKIPAFSFLKLQISSVSLFSSMYIPSVSFLSSRFHLSPILQLQVPL